MADETPIQPGASLEPLKCGAETRKEGNPPCSNPAGMRTVHLGKGRCYLHGGVQPNDGRLDYVRYSHTMRTRFAELQEEFAKDPDPLDIMPEIYALRALYIDWINRYDLFTESLINWHLSFATGEKVSKPTKVMDIAEAWKMLDAISKMVERVEGIKQRRVIALVSPEVQERVIAQVSLIGGKKTWDSNELLTALSSVWK